MGGKGSLSSTSCKAQASAAADVEHQCGGLPLPKPSNLPALLVTATPKPVALRGAHLPFSIEPSKYQVASSTSGELKSGDEVLRHICDAIGRGAFIATNDKSDCGYCDYLSICGEPYETAASSYVQLSTCNDPALEPMRNLRSVELSDLEDLR